MTGYLLLLFLHTRCGHSRGQSSNEVFANRTWTAVDMHHALLQLSAFTLAMEVPLLNLSSALILKTYNGRNENQRNAVESP
jgi:hypothetical protein